MNEQAFQQKVARWISACFGPEAKNDVKQRTLAFLEEALELAQSAGCTQEEAYQLVDYVYGRPAGAVAQEIGGVMLTLFSLGDSMSEDVELCGTLELIRVNLNIEKIRAKQAAKVASHPSPGGSISEPEQKEILTPQCGNCSRGKVRHTDRKGALSAGYITCGRGSVQEGNHIRQDSDWCDGWRAKA